MFYLFFEMFKSLGTAHDPPPFAKPNGEGDHRRMVEGRGGTPPSAA